MPVNVDNKTPRLDLPLPDASNFLQDDVERLKATINDLDGQVALVAADGKLKPEQLPDNAAKVDAGGILVESQLPVKVVTVDANGKVPISRIPDAALANFREVGSQSAMLGLGALIGDTVLRVDTQKYYVLAKNPASVLANWRELPPSAVYSVNGQTGDVSGLAKSGVNNDITQLTGLQGSFALPADGTAPYDAVTVRQLQSVTAGQGATMNGVMNNFIGAVEWFNGSRTQLPAGYIAADGQLLSRTDPATIDLWTAVDKGFLLSNSEALWMNSGDPGAENKNRGRYSMGDGATTFRVPDLNGTSADGVAAAFLRGDAGGRISTLGSIGQMYLNGAPNIIGGVSNVINHGTPVTGNSLSYAGEGDPGLVASPNPGVQFRFRNVNLDASKSSPAYGRLGTNEVRPNYVVGIWIIRASGAFQAANTNFRVVTADATVPAPGTTTYGGSVESVYQTHGTDFLSAALRAKVLHGKEVYATLGIKYGGGPLTDVLSISNAGELSVGAVTVDKGLTTAPGWGLGVRAAEQNSILINNAPNGVTRGQFVNWTHYQWYAGYVETGIVRGGTTDIADYRIQMVPSDTGTGSTNWAFRPDGSIGTNNGDLAPKAPSDRNRKHDIAPFDGKQSLNNILKMRPVTFVFNDDERERTRRGFIAQELELIDPDYVQDGMDIEGRPIKYLDKTPMLLDAIIVVRQLVNDVKDLKLRNAELEERLINLSK
ncbi:tail fiber domain-containing protein [Salmonella enterica]|nr:tail fiber domain-containing protein [Salmonella enterica]